MAVDVAVLLTVAVLVAVQPVVLMWVLRWVVRESADVHLRSLHDMTECVSSTVRAVLGGTEPATERPFDQDGHPGQNPEEYRPPWADWGEGVDLDPLPDPLAGKDAWAQTARVHSLPDFTKLNSGETDE